MPSTDNQSELETLYIKVQVDYAPKDDEEKFKEWCKKYQFDYLGLEGRGAWCGQLGTYFRGADGVAFYDGEMFLFYKEDDDIFDIQAHDTKLYEQVMGAIEGQEYDIEACEKQIRDNVKSEDEAEMNILSMHIEADDVHDTLDGVRTAINKIFNKEV